MEGLTNPQNHIRGRFLPYHRNLRNDAVETVPLYDSKPEQYAEFCC